jgi:hypothetical protein
VVMLRAKASLLAFLLCLPSVAVAQTFNCQVPVPTLKDQIDPGEYLQISR